MAKRACVFVDGENLRHAIIQLFEYFQQSDYLPKKANWSGLFDHLAEMVCPGAERMRAYWYVIEGVDYRPSRIPNPAKEEALAIKSFAPHDPRLTAAVEAGDRTLILERLRVDYAEADRRKTDMAKRSDGWRTVQSGIAREERAVEFRRAGRIRYDLYECQFGPEKAVDVKLAVDMVTLADIYDVAIIVSGDQDYVPAVQVVKDRGKQTANVAFETRGGRLLPGGAHRLNEVTDGNVRIKYADAAKFLFPQGVPGPKPAPAATTAGSTASGGQ